MMHGTMKLKNLGTILRSYLNWVDQVKHTVQNACKALFFVMRVLKKENKKTKSLAYTSLVSTVLEYGAVCREEQLNVIDRVQRKAAQFANYT